MSGQEGLSRVAAGEATPPGAARLEGIMRDLKSGLLSVGFFSLFINLLVLAVPLYMIQIFDRVMTSRSFDTLWVLTFGAVVALGVMASLDLVRTRLLVRIGVWIDRTLSGRILAAGLRSGLARRQDASETCEARLRDLASLRGFFTGSGILALIDAPWAPIFLAVVALLHPALGTVAFLGAGGLFALAWLNDRLTRAGLARAGLQQGRLLRTVAAIDRQQEAVAGLGMTEGLVAKVQGMGSDQIREQAEVSDRAGTLLAASRFLRYGLQITLLATAAVLVIGQEISVGAMIASSIVLSRALSPVEQAIGVWRQVIQAKAAYGRIATLLARDPAAGEDSLSLPAPRGELTVERVAYQPLGSRDPIFEGASFQAEPGQLIGITGQSGAGKSTLARLLIGIERPLTGSVRLDGAETALWAASDLGRQIGYVPQGVELIPGTVRDNIARFALPAGDGKSEALRKVDDVEVIAAATLVGIHQRILALPRGYDTEVGGSAEPLSLGMRQRIAIARAVFRRPRYLVLDEPYSNLDAEGVRGLVAALDALKEAGSTVIMIAHRPSLLARCDRVLLLDNRCLREVERTKRAQLRVLGGNGEAQAQPAPVEAPAEAAEESSAETPTLAVASRRGGRKGSK